MSIRRFLSAAVLATLLAACAPTSRGGMIVDRNSGLQFGSVMEKNFVVDASQFRNNKVKIRIRNTSGDVDFGIKEFRRQIAASLEAAGYEIVSSNDFGILFDVNVRYAGQATSNLSKEFAVLGALGGGVGVGSGLKGTTGAILSGATLGAIVGSYVREETFTIVSDVSLGFIDRQTAGSEKKISFGGRAPKKKKRTRNFHGFHKRVTSQIAVYAGGRNISSKDIAQQVKQRLARILGDAI